ncbi:MAG: helix-turn-helix transcriptional regulator [Clostridiales bacterium]|nr:helix-turn-helix transcriptional regulator [Clostridiales bacterium]
MNKSTFIKNCSKKLGKNINQFIISTQNEKNKLTRVAFGEKVNKLLGLDNFDTQSIYKKVSRWISADAFPDLPTIIAIAKVMGVSIDELFRDEINTLSKTAHLTIEEKNILKKLILNKNKYNNRIANMYVPYAFNKEEIDVKQDIFTRDEIIKIYTEKAADKWRMNNIGYFIELYNNIKNKENIQELKKHFSRVYSVKFIEQNEQAENLEPIIYSNTPVFYSKINEYWKTENSCDFYNIEFFEEKSYDFDMDLQTIDMALVYKSKIFAETVYKKNFESLINKGIITPSKEEAFVAEWSDGTVTEGVYQMDKRINIFTNGDGYNTEYTLETICFSFDINLTEIEINDFLRNEKQGE